MWSLLMTWASSTAWWPQGNQISYMVAHVSKSKCSSKQKNGSYMAFSDLAPEVKWRYFYNILLVLLMKAVANLPRFKEKGHRTTIPKPSGISVKKPVALLYNTIFFNPQAIIFWGSRRIIPVSQMGTSRFREVKESTQPELQIAAHKTHCQAFLTPSFVLAAFPQTTPSPDSRTLFALPLPVGLPALDFLLFWR